MTLVKSKKNAHYNFCSPYPEKPKHFKPIQLFFSSHFLNENFEDALHHIFKSLKLSEISENASSYGLRELKKTKNRKGTLTNPKT